jgi:uncharacterized protein YkwD
MRNYLPLGLAVLLVLMVPFSSPKAQAGSSFAPAGSTASDLIDAVNSLRATYGLPAYQPNSILMGIAQTHAEYMAAIGVSNVHTDAQGLLPFQRALAAGYMVAGDLALHGFFSENVIGGVGMTPQDAVNEWMGDEPHLNTMVASTLFDVGAGVAVVGNTFYYCLDAGRSNGGTPVAYTPPAPLYTSVPTIIPNTPNADGSIFHIIQPGDTIGTIAEAYDVPIADLLRLNNITLQSKIYAGNKLIIHAANTPTPTQPTGTPTELPTITAWPTSTPTFTETPLLPTPPPSPGLPASAARNSVFAIIAAALVIAGLIALIGRKRN